MIDHRNYTHNFSSYVINQSLQKNSGLNGIPTQDALGDTGQLRAGLVEFFFRL